MNEAEIPESQLTTEEMTVWPGNWFDIPDNLLTLMLHGTAVVGLILVMLVGLILLFRRLKELGRGFGPSSLKSLAVLLFLPCLVLLALLTDFATETLAVLFGTVVGYVLSSVEDRSQESNSARRSGGSKIERD